MPRKPASPNYASIKWMMDKVVEHDKLLQDIFQLLRELKKETDMNNQKVFIDIIRQYENADQDYVEGDEIDEPDDEVELEEEPDDEPEIEAT